MQQIVEKGTWEPSVMNKDSYTLDRLVEVEMNVEVDQREVEKLETKLLQAKDVAHVHAGEKLEQRGLSQENMDKANMGIEDTVNAQERLQFLEKEARQLRNELSDSQSKIMQLEQYARQLRSELNDSQSKIMQLEQNATLAARKLDDLALSALIMGEKEAILQEQLAAAEFRAKIAEEKFDMQTELLQKEMRMTVEKDDELTNGGAIFNKHDIDFIRLTEKLQAIESHFKSPNNKSVINEKLAKPNKENTVKEIGWSTKCNELSEKGESSTKQGENAIPSLEEDLHGFAGCVSSSEPTEDSFKQTETNVFMTRAEMNQSQEQNSKFRKSLITSEFLVDVKDKLAHVEQELISATLREIELQNQLRVYEEQLTMQESIINQTTIRCMELEELFESQAKDTEMKCLQAKEAFMHAVAAAKRLDEKLRPLEMRGKKVDTQEVQSSASAAGSQMELARRTTDIARGVFLPFRAWKDKNDFAFDVRTSQISDSIQSSNRSFKLVLGVALLFVLIGFILANH